MSTVRYYRHDDAGAPTLSGQVGALTNLLRKCLVGTSGIAYGAKPSAGWSEAFIGAAANIAVFRNNAAEGGSGAYMRVDDNASGAGAARDAKLTGYAVMTDINTGSNATASPWVRKSQTADATARKWLVVADGLTAWVFVWENGGAIGLGRDCAIMGLGDYACVVPSSAYRYFAMGGEWANDTFSHIRALLASTSAHQSQTDMGNGLTVPALDGISAVVQARIEHPTRMVTGAMAGVGGSIFPANPHPISGDTYFERDPVMTQAGVLLGRLRGLVLPFQSIISAPAGVAYAPIPGAVLVKSRAMDYTNNECGAAFLVDTAGPWL